MAAAASMMDRQSLSSDVYRPVIAAIDFGTSSSGYAFAFQDKHTETVKAKEIHLNQWKIGSASSTTEKAPTTVLLKPDKTFDSFGYKAEDKYAKLCDTNRHTGWRYFQKFKMLLYETKNLTRDVEIFDAEHKPMPALEVFSLVIGHLKDKLLNDIRIQNNTIKDDDILYVLTVPAIWSDAAKQFMREAATSPIVGITNDQLKLVQEPEAASVYCRQTPSCSTREADGSLRLTTLPVGHKYIILDLGGGTADIASHEVIKDEMLHEIYNARGDDMGGERFNKDFVAFLADLFGPDLFEQWKNAEKGDFVTLQRTIEGIKWEISESDADDDIMCTLPMSFLTSLQKYKAMPFESQIQRSKYSNHVQAFGTNKILINLQFIRDLFTGVLSGLQNHITEIVKKQEGIKTIFLVGGLAKSEYIRQHILQVFPTYRLVVPEDPGVAVLKGAVLLGNRPKTIAGRIAQFSYGINQALPFIEGKHNPEYKFERDGKVYCNFIFAEIIKKGTIMRFGQQFKTEPFIEATLETSKQIVFDLILYQSEKETPAYTTDAGCARLCGMKLSPPKTGWNERTNLTVSLIVGEAEFRFLVKDDQGQEIETKVDFLLRNQ